MEKQETTYAAIAALIPAEQLKAATENSAAFEPCVKRLGGLLEKCPAIGVTDTLPEHPAIFHFFYGATDIYICEYNKRNLVYGHAVFGGDLKTAEWAFFFLSDITRLPKINIDFDFGEMSIEAALYLKYPEHFKKPFSLEGDTVLQKDGPLPEAYKETPYQYIRTHFGTILYRGKSEVYLQGDDQTIFFRHCNRAKQRGIALSAVIDGYFPC
jgi:hypothetical protein